MHHLFVMCTIGTNLHTIIGIRRRYNINVLNEASIRTNTGLLSIRSVRAMCSMTLVGSVFAGGQSIASKCIEQMCRKCGDM